jgi:hypothetical protein
LPAPGPSHSSGLAGPAALFTQSALLARGGTSRPRRADRGTSRRRPVLRGTSPPRPVLRGTSWPRRAARRGMEGPPIAESGDEGPVHTRPPVRSAAPTRPPVRPAAPTRCCVRTVVGNSHGPWSQYTPVRWVRYHEPTQTLSHAIPLTSCSRALATCITGTPRRAQPGSCRTPGRRAALGWGKPRVAEGDLRPGDAVPLRLIHRARHA